MNREANFVASNPQSAIELAVRARASARAVAGLRGVVLALRVGRGRAGVLPLDVLPVLRAVLLALGVCCEVRGRLIGLICAHRLPLNKFCFRSGPAAVPTSAV